MSDQLSSGDIVADRYQVLGILGRGNAGIVYRVQQIFLRKEFALKFLTRVSSEKSALRFQREAQAVSKLNHPNLVQAIDFGISESRLFFVMELLDGETLSDALRKRERFSLQEALEIFIPIAEGLAYAHEVGIVHRDVKPSNIVLQKNALGEITPKLIDFGLAQMELDAQEIQSLTQSGNLLGTPLYMSPEQCQGIRVDLRSDIYSLGCTLYEALTGFPPFRGASPLETLAMHSSTPVPTLAEGADDAEFSAGIEVVIANTLTKEPGERYQRCEELIVDLRRLQQEEFIEKTEDKSAADVSKTVSRSSSVWLIGGSIVLMVASIVFAVWQMVVSNSDDGNSAKLEKKIRAQQELNTPVREFGNQKLQDTVMNRIDSAVKDGKVIAQRPFATISSGKRIFRFPAKYPIGKLIYRVSDAHWNSASARGEVVVPESSKIIFKTDRAILVEPDLAFRFHKGDIQGLIVETTDFFNSPAQVNTFVRNICNIESIRYLSLLNMDISNEACQEIGGMRELRWLALEDSTVPLVDVRKLKMANLNVLNVQSSDHRLSSAILRELVRSGATLNRLRMCHCDLDAQDVALISNLQTISVLSLDDNWRNTALPRNQREAILRNIARLKNLEILSLDKSLVDKLDLSNLQGLKKLKKIWLSDPTISNEQSIGTSAFRGGTVSCVPVFPEGREAVEANFDPRSAGKADSLW